MKRFISFLLMIFLLISVFASCTVSSETSVEYTFPDAEYAVNAADMAVVGDKIYYISDEKVYETASPLPVFEEFPVIWIAAAGNELAVFGGGQVKIGERLYHIGNDEIASFVIVNNTICWVYYEDTYPRLGFYNMNNDDSISLTPLDGADCRLIPFTDTSILVCCYKISGEMYTYEFNTLSMKPSTFVTEEVFVSAASADEDTLITLLSTGLVNIRHLADGSEEKRNPCEELSKDVEKLYFAGNSAVFLTENGTIYVRKDYVRPVEPNNTVVILQDKENGYFGEFGLEKLRAALEEQGLEVALNECSDEKVCQKQLAGDNDYDLYVSDGYSIVLDLPYYEPLNEYTDIADRFDLMYDEIRDICTFENQIYGVLLNLQVQNSLWSYNAELLKELGMTLPDSSWTLEDYYELAVELRAQGHYISKFSPLFIGDYLHVFGDLYETGSLTDDGKILREYLEIMKKLQDEGLLYEKETAEKGAKILFGSSSEPFRFDYNDPDVTPELILCDVWYPVTFDGRMADMTIMKFLQMNKHSRNKENAALVIAECMKPEYVERLELGEVFYKESGETIRSISKKAEANLEIYLNVLANSRPWYIFDRTATQFMSEEAEKYCSNEQDLEQTSARIYERAKMLFEE